MIRTVGKASVLATHFTTDLPVLCALRRPAIILMVCKASFLAYSPCLGCTEHALLVTAAV